MKREKKRCPWLNLKNPLYVTYHDEEWGRPAHDDNHLFEMITLEGAQAGLSWETVLKKRERYREVFFHFDPIKVAKITPTQVKKILQDPGIIRNRLKVESTVSNAKAFLAIQKEWGSFDQYLWSFLSEGILYNSFKSMKDYPTRNEVSDALSKDLKKRGFRFVGTTIMYAFMQAVGMTQDHGLGCYLHRKKF